MVLTKSNSNRVIAYHNYYFHANLQADSKRTSESNRLKSVFPSSYPTRNSKQDFEICISS